MPDSLAAGVPEFLRARARRIRDTATVWGIGRSTYAMGEGPMRGLLGFRQRPLHGWLRRLRFVLRRWFTNRPTGTQRIYRVDVDGRTAKRIVFPDSYEAARVARSLRVFGPSGIVPAVLLQRERDLWLEFVEGQPLNELDSIDEETLERLAEVFATLYSREPRLVALDRTSFAHALFTDLEFLRDVGVLSSGVQELLAEFTERKAPKEVWVGYDCTDAILKNFVREPSGRVRLVDAETVGVDQMIGTGVAKASLRWLGPRRDAFVESLVRRGAPDFRGYLDWAELSFAAFWVKSSFLERKKRFIDAGVFDRFLGGNP